MSKAGSSLSLTSGSSGVLGFGALFLGPLGVLPAIGCGVVSAGTGIASLGCKVASKVIIGDVERELSKINGKLK